MSIDVFPASVLNSTLWNGQSMPLQITQGGTGAITAALARTNLGLGTMAQQDASAVAITGGSVTGLGVLSTGNATMTGVVAMQSYAGVQLAPAANVALGVGQYKNLSQFGIFLRAMGSDTNTYGLFLANVAGTGVGSIMYDGTTTTFNTTSDARLKRDVHPLTGALDVVRALRPITHLWKADDSRGYGFSAHEVQEVIPGGGIVTGDKDAVDGKGNIVPQMIDMSKLMPWVIAALQDMLTRLELLEARL